MLRDISFDVRDNEFVSILGPSGCGKTTLLRMLAGLDHARRRPRRGRGPRASRARPRSAPSCSSSSRSLPWMNVARQHRLRPATAGRAPRRHGRPSARALRRTGRSCRVRAGLPRASCPAACASAPAIARALTMDPSILLMDEPFGALRRDQPRKRMNLELLRIWSQTETSVVFVTHSIAEALLLSDRILLLTGRPGKVQEYLDVPFQRPRDRSITTSLEFQRYREHLWQQLRATQIDEAVARHRAGRLRWGSSWSGRRACRCGRARHPRWRAPRAPWQAGRLTEIGSFIAGPRRVGGPGAGPARCPGCLRSARASRPSWTSSTRASS